MAETQELFNNPRHPYTGALIQSRPKVGERVRRLQTIEGNVPAPLDLPPGCPFVTRCPNRLPECAALKPPLVEMAPDHWVACFNPL